MRTRIIETMIVAIALSAGFLWGSMSQKTNYEEALTYSDNIQMSAYEALVYIDNAIYAHEFYIKRPELQNAGTGDTAYNEKTIRQYTRLKALIEKLGGGQ